LLAEHAATLLDLDMAEVRRLSKATPTAPDRRLRDDASLRRIGRGDAGDESPTA
jgi:hypothetical protein